MRRLLASVVLLVSLAGSASAAEQQPGQLAGTSRGAGTYVPGHVVVEYEPGTTAAEHADVRAESDTPRVRALPVRQTEVVRAPAGESAVAAAAELRRDPAVRYATPDWVVDNMALPNDPQLSREWALANTGAGVNYFTDLISGGGLPTSALAGSDINASAAWNTTTGSDSVVVAVMDGGFDYQLPDLAPQVWSNPGEIAGNGVDDDHNGFVDDTQGWDFIGGDKDPFDEQFHGTHVAGTIGARGNDGVGVSGVTQRVKLMNVRLTDADGSGTLSSALGALDYAGKMGARVANGSFVFTGLTDPDSRAMIESKIAAHPNTLYVFAAGNGGDDGVGDDVNAGSSGDNEILPCEFPDANIVCVAATDQADRLATFSNYGSTSVDLGAPGVDVLSDWARATYFDFGPSGTESASTAWPTADRGAWGTSAASPFDGLDGAGLSDSPGGPYTDSTTPNVALSRPIAIPTGANRCQVSYVRDLALATGDTASVEILRDGVSYGGFNYTSASNTGARRAFIYLPGMAGTTARVRVTVTGNNDGGVAGGLTLGSIKLDCDPAKGQPGSYGYLDGTSMATPQVTGAAALLLAKNPGLSVAQVKSALITTGDPVADLAGATVSGRRLDLAAAIASVPGVPGPNGGSTGAGAAAGPSPSTAAVTPSAVRPLVKLSLGGLPSSLQLDSSGTATIAVSGAPGTSGTLTVTTAKAVSASASARKKKRKKAAALTLATKRFAVPASGATKVKILVSGRALGALKKAKRLSATVTVKAGAQSATRSTTVKAPKPKVKKRKKR